MKKLQMILALLLVLALPAMAAATPSQETDDLWGKLDNLLDETGALYENGDASGVIMVEGDVPIVPDGSPEATSSPSPVPYASPFETLNVGSRGENVVLLQQKLVELKLLSGEVDGKYGWLTANAIKQYREQYIDKVADPFIQMYLFDILPDSPEARELRTIAEGSEGEKVTRLQEALKAHGLLGGSADGKYGDGTGMAIENLKRSLVDFTVDQYTMARLFWDGPEMELEIESEIAQPTAESTMEPMPTFELTPITMSTPVPVGTATSRRTLQIGDTGEDVERLQAKLKELGYFDGEINGLYGKSTADAVESFQQGLVSGIADITTQDRIFGAR